MPIKDKNIFNSKNKILLINRKKCFFLHQLIPYLLSAYCLCNRCACWITRHWKDIKRRRFKFHLPLHLLVVHQNNKHILQFQFFDLIQIQNNSCLILLNDLVYFLLHLNLKLHHVEKVHLVHNLLLFRIFLFHTYTLHLLICLFLRHLNI